MDMMEYRKARGHGLDKQVQGMAGSLKLEKGILGSQGARGWARKTAEGR